MRKFDVLHLLGQAQHQLKVELDEQKELAHNQTGISPDHSEGAKWGLVRGIDKIEEVIKKVNKS